MLKTLHTLYVIEATVLFPCTIKPNLLKCVQLVLTDFEFWTKEMNAISEARYNLGIAYLNATQYKEAIHEFEAVTQLDADFIDAHCGLSCAYLELNELDKAETSALAALNIDSDYPSALSLVDAVKNSRYDNGITYLNDER